MERRILMWLCVGVFFVSASGLAQADSPTMDLKVAYDPAGDAAQITWYPAFPSGVSSFEVYCYGETGALVTTEVAGLGDRTLTITAVASRGLKTCVVHSLDGSQAMIEYTPVEPFQRSQLMISRNPGSRDASFPGILRCETVTGPRSSQLEISVVGGCDASGFPPYVRATLEVLDAGVPVTGLVADAFSVTEDGRPQTITDFEASYGLADIVFLIDNSGSMYDKIEDVKNNVQAFADALAAENVNFRLGLVGFGQLDDDGEPRIYGTGLTDDAVLFKQWVESMPAEGVIEPGLATIRRAIQDFNFRPGSQKHFILITDEDSDCLYSPCSDELEATTDMILAAGVVVHTAVDCNDGIAQEQYCNDTTSVRGVSGGCAEAITAPFSQLLSDCILPDIVNNYIVTYESDNPVTDCQPRTVEWCVDDGTSSDCDQCTFNPGQAPTISRTAATLALHNQPLTPGDSPVIEVIATDTCAPLLQDVILFVRTAGSGAAYQQVLMAPQGGDVYQAVIPAALVVEPGVDYYCRATDGVLSASDPSTDPESHPYQLAVDPNYAPVIEHTPPSCWPESVDLPLEIHLQDTTYGLSSVTVHYRRAGSAIWLTEGETFASPEPTDIVVTITIPGSSVQAPAIEYYIEATDNRGLTQLSPLGGAADPYVVGMCQTTLTLVPDKTCVTGHEEVQIAIQVANLPEEIVGGQFFLEFTHHGTCWAFMDGSPVPPYDMEIYELEPEAGQIDYAIAVVPPTGGYMEDGTMAIIHMMAMPNVEECCHVTIGFRAHTPATLLTKAGGGTIVPTLIPAIGDTIDITIDMMPPSIVDCASDVVVQCSEDVPPGATTYAEFAALGGHAEDNCTSSEDLLVQFEDVSDGMTCPETIIRTYTLIDECGNFAECVQTITVHDTIFPTGTEPTDIVVECPEDVPPCAQDIFEFQLIGGSASDNCTLPEDLVITCQDESDGMTCPETITRTYTITDECGNATELDPQTITVDDTIAPEGTPPADEEVQCPEDVAPCAEDIFEFELIGGSASDNCTLPEDLVIACQDVTDGMTCPETITRTYSITDECENFIEVTQTIIVDDTIAPEATAPGDIVVQCPEDVPPGATTYDEFVAIGGTASDNCTEDDDLVITFVDVSDGMTCPETITRTYTITDECGNFVQVIQIITVDDTIAPDGVPPTDDEVQCPEDVPPGATTYAEFVAVGGTASDNCTEGDDLVITFVDESDGLTCPETITRTYTITDECGTSTELDPQIITVHDTIAPVFVVCPDAPEPLVANVYCEALVPDLCALAVIDDNCDANPVCTQDPPAGATIGFGDTLVTLTATDECDNISTCTVLVTVLAESEMLVNVELSPPVAPGPFTRCITFELYETPGVVAETVHEVITFTNGLAMNVPVRVPCGSGSTYIYVTAQDELHTLVRVDEDLEILGDQYVADFTGKPDEGGDWLIGGNFIDDGYIDIVDYGVLYGEWNTCYGAGCPGVPDGSTDCSTVWPHCDSSGNGVTFIEDLTFIIVNFLEADEAIPGTVLRDKQGPRTRISVEELRSLKLNGAVSADVNGDGWVDVDDMAIVLRKG